jgi:hypothetical protein
MDITAEEDEMVTTGGPAMVTVPTIVTVPAIVPLWRKTDATPFTVDTVSVVGVPSSRAPIYSPPLSGVLPPPGPLITKSTDVPSEIGLPFISFTANVTREVSV